VARAHQGGIARRKTSLYRCLPTREEQDHKRAMLLDEMELAEEDFTS